MKCVESLYGDESRIERVSDEAAFDMVHGDSYGIPSRYVPKHVWKQARISHQTERRRVRRKRNKLKKLKVKPS